MQNICKRISVVKIQLLFALASAVTLGACDATTTKPQSSFSIFPPVCSDQFDRQGVSQKASDDRTSYQRFIVKVAKHTDALSTAGMKALKVIKSLEQEGKVEVINPEFISVQFDQAVSTEEAGRRMDKEDFEYIEPDFMLTTTFVPNDPGSPSQWAHQMIDSQQAWDISKGSSAVVVAVLDTGVDYTHADLAANMWRNPNETVDGSDNDGDGYTDDIYGWDFYNNDSDPMSDDASSYHGTHVAGTIGAVGNNGIGITGHAPDVKLMALKFLGSGGSGPTSGAIRAIDYAISKKVKIISNSWGGSSYSQALSDAIDRARDAKILFVVAAGNAGANNDNTSFYPANYPQDNIVRVAATDSSDSITSWSNYGRSVDVAAPGANIYSTKNGNSYQSLSGTSMATPLVSGVLATMIAARPDLPYWQQKFALIQGSDIVASMKDKVAADGRVNAYRAVSNAMGLPPSNPDVPAPPACN